MSGHVLCNGHVSNGEGDFLIHTTGSSDDWDEQTVISKLREHKISEEVVSAFADAGIKGRCFKGLNFCNLMSEMKLSWHQCLEVRDFMVQLGCWPTPIKENLKIFNDPIHGNIELHPVCLAVIDTPEFQRLRYIKQLGLCYFVYPGAAHNRFEHSLGVCHLAGVFIRHLRENQPELGIDDNDVRCLELAGLCHDIGHGPFSHVFDAKFIPKATGRAWKHEEASRDMFNHIVEVHGLMRTDGIFQKYGLTECDMQFITELIAGPSKRGYAAWPYVGRPKEKAYLYEIVANKRNCIDVDKWDYIARDCHQLGIRNNFDHIRFIKFARVIEADGEMQICVRDKEMLNLYNMFSTRYGLHKNAYQHRVNCALDIMVQQALLKADKYVKTKGKNGAMLRISECIDDMLAYSHLTDHVLFRIVDTELPAGSPSESLEELDGAKKVIRRIFNRELFKCLSETYPLGPHLLEGVSEQDIKEKILQNCHGNIVQEEDFFITIVDLDFGMKDENPVEKLNCYSKSNPDEARHLTKEEISRILLPYSFKEQLVRIYIVDRKHEVKSDILKKAWKEWVHDDIEIKKDINEEVDLLDRPSS